ncbi:WD40 repeat-like protein [Artomyces pyxidatus]|uniref:WD40 repeat-like protein n=1 Tax=Artomyces pyxidatus TaxID=48021 RepID=A0ACB8SDZ7_9AGAM|nr:WD40 repeat-like protein [Artomyces pyxidatus]
MSFQLRLKYRLTRSKHAGDVGCLDFSHEGRYLASGGLDGKLEITSLDDGELHHTIETPGAISALNWLPKTPCKLVCACSDGLVINVSVNKGSLSLVYFRVYSHIIQCLAVESSGRYLATGAADDIRIWTSRDEQHNWEELTSLGKPRQSGDSRDAEVVLVGLHWRNDNQNRLTLLATYRDHGIQIWDVCNATVVHSVPTRLPMHTSTISSDGAYLVTAKSSVYDMYYIDTGIVEKTWEHDLPGAAKYPVIFLHNGFAVCAQETPGTVSLWSSSEGYKLQSVQHSGEINEPHD